MTFMSKRPFALVSRMFRVLKLLFQSLQVLPIQLQAIADDLQLQLLSTFLYQSTIAH